MIDEPEKKEAALVASNLQQVADLAIANGQFQLGGFLLMGSKTIGALLQRLAPPPPPAPPSEEEKDDEQ